MEKTQEQSKVIPFVENYKKIRGKFFEAPKPVLKTAPVQIPVQVAPQPKPKSPEDLVAKNGTGKTARDIDKETRTLITEAEKRGISYYQRLIEHAPAMSKGRKLAILVVLEEYAISWDELFTKDRPTFKSLIRWKVFRALRDEGMSLNEIARICDVDHTSVIYGLRKVSSEDLK